MKYCRIQLLILTSMFCLLPTKSQSNEEPICMIEVQANGYARNNVPIAIDMNPYNIASKLESPIQVIEINANGETTSSLIPCQYNAHSQILYLLPSGEMNQDGARHFIVISKAQIDVKQKPLIHVKKLDEYEGDEAWKITTPSATYFYHVHGAAFASMIDNDGNDWISHHPEGGFEGNYRGIPNIAPPLFHPGDKESTSRIVAQGPIQLEIYSETNDGQWKCQWEIFPTFAKMTLLKKGKEPYWILYEGTPGGAFEPEDDYWVDSSGARHYSSNLKNNEVWRKDLPDPEWVYFGDDKLDRVMAYLHHPAEDSVEEYWHRGKGGMTVFGFGRGDQKIAWQQLNAVPKTLFVGFIESNQFQTVKQTINSYSQGMSVKVLLN